MSYANLAGLPNVYGLYGAFVPCIVYAFFGTSRQLVCVCCWWWWWWWWGGGVWGGGGGWLPASRC
jgi:hypothetical protein